MTSRKDKNAQATKKPLNINKYTDLLHQLLTTFVEALVQENNCPFQGDVEQKDGAAHR